MPRQKKTHSEEVKEEGQRKKSLGQEEGKAMEAPGAEMAPLSPMAGDPLALLAKPEMAHPANAPLRARAMTALQRQRGNAYVQRVVGRIQAKLRINEPGDRYEREADRVAEEVVQMPEPQVQRQPEEEEEEEEEEPIEAKPVPGRTAEVPPDLGDRVNAIRRSGQPLTKSARAFFEPRFGQDLSQARLHTDAQAAETAEVVRAQAFTVGQDIVFGAGQYAPETATGKKLLAHELTHVVQQEGATRTPLSRVSQPSDLLERQAETVAQSIAEAHSVTKRPETAGVLARQETEAKPLTLGKWAWTGEGWRYAKLRSQLETAGYKFINRVLTETGKWEKGFPKPDTPAEQVAWEIVSPEGKLFWATTANIVSKCEKLMKSLPPAKPEAVPGIKMLKDPDVAAKDPNLIADTPEGVAYVEKHLASSAMLTIKGRKVKVGPGTKFGKATFIARIGGKVYFKWENTIRACSVAEFERGFELEEIAREVYKRTKWIVPVARYEALLVMVVLRPDLALDVAGNIIAGKSIIDEEAMRGYCASAIFGPLSKIKMAGKAAKAVDILVDVAKAAGESAFQELMKDGKLKSGKFTEDILKSVLTGQMGKHIAKLPADSKKILAETNEKLREIGAGLIGKEAGAAYEAGKAAVTK